MKNRHLLTYLGLFLLLGIIACGEKGELAKLPNIIVILADDAGYVDFGFMGSKDLETPHLDELAKDGVVFTDAHVSASVCAPSRAGLISGRYQQRFGNECNAIPKRDGLPIGERTIGTALKDLGYATMALGKWHLGTAEAFHPNERGFDEFYGFLSGGRSYFPSEQADRPGRATAVLHNRQHQQFEGYLTDVLGDKAVDYIAKSKEKPFFMYLAFNAVHTPMHAKAEHLEKYKAHTRKELAAMTWSMDENIGKVISKLKDEGLYDNTLIFFLSDNGGATNNQSSGGPLKGWKGNKFEGGHRVPFTVTWPNKIKGGQRFSGLTSSLDIFATSLIAAGGELPTDRPLDGVNLLPFLSGNATGHPHTTLFWRKDKMAAARQGTNKLIRLKDYGLRTYDLEKDLGETIDISSASPNIEKQLSTALENWEKQLEAPRWIEEAQWNEVTYEIHQALMENRVARYVNPSQMRRYQERNKN